MGAFSRNRFGSSWSSTVWASSQCLNGWQWSRASLAISLRNISPPLTLSLSLSLTHTHTHKHTHTHAGQCSWWKTHPGMDVNIGGAKGAPFFKPPVGMTNAAVMVLWPGPLLIHGKVSVCVV